MIKNPVLGFGKSDKYTNPDNYTHELHCFTLRKLLDHLDVSAVIIFGFLQELCLVRLRT